MTHHKILMINPYFGKPPAWFPAFLQSCKSNSSIDWLFLMDCVPPVSPPPNIKLVPFSLAAFNQLASRHLGFEVNITHPHKLCDFKPAYGLIFQDYLAGYDFWGHCDVDTILGDIRQFITPELLTNYDIISAQQERMCGHFCLYRNTTCVNWAFTHHPAHRLMLNLAVTSGFDEGAMTEVVRNLSDRGSLTVYWSKRLANFKNPVDNGSTAYLGPITNGWQWRQGKLYHQADEILYMHFMNWKRSLNACHFNYGDEVESFYISFSHIGLDQSDLLPPPTWLRAFLTWHADFWSRRFAALRSEIVHHGQRAVIQKIMLKLFRKLVRQPA